MAAQISKFLVFIFDPTYHWFAGGVLVFFLILMGKKSRAKTPLFLLLVYMAVILFTPICFLLVKSLEVKFDSQTLAEPKAAVVVLSGGTVEFNLKTNQYHWYQNADRILVPARNWSQSESLFIVSGKDVSSKKAPYFLSETRSMGQFLQESNIPENRIVLELEARTTRENAEKVVSILQEKGITDFYLVTSAFHMWRSVESFRKLGVEPTPFPVDFFSDPGSGESVPMFGYRNIYYFRLAVHEYVGMFYYKLLDWLAKSDKSA